MEHPYEFRKRLNTVHVPRRHHEAQPNPGEVVIDDTWEIAIPAAASDYLLGIAQDLQDYFLRSHELSLRLTKRHLRQAGPPSIWIHAGGDPELRKKRSYSIRIGEDRADICGFDERGAGQGAYYLEDLMNLRAAPFLPKIEKCVREPVFSPRMTHSGWALDRFPDPHLNAIAHAGMDAVLLFIENGVDQTRSGRYDVNDLVRRAAAYGLDVYLYPLLHCNKHPDEAGAHEYYDQLYGRLIRSAPGVKGIVFVGESCSFPTRDPHTCGRSWWEQRPENDNRPWNGFWPSSDFPQWLELVKSVMRRYNPELDIVFWTYNWGWVEEKERLALIEKLPAGITLEATFEMFEKIEKGGVTMPIADYSISFPGPGKYFASEAALAARRGIPLYAMSNTGGQTWDIGVIPYVPAPMLWKERWDALRKANRDWNLTGLMESHHYGWQPSFVSELSKEAYWTNGAEFSAHLRRIAERDFGAEGAEAALGAWSDWSEAFRDCTTTGMDQYGPLRIGPSYPLVFPGETVEFPCTGLGRIMKPYYRMNPQDVRPHIDLLAGMEKKLASGNEKMRLAVRSAPPPRVGEAERMLALGGFILAAIRTVIHVKQWFACTLALAAPESSRADKLAALDTMEAIAKAEIANAQAAIPFVERDSSLGYEHTMMYMTDRAHLEWKISQVQRNLDHAIPAFRTSL